MVICINEKPPASKLALLLIIAYIHGDILLDPPAKIIINMIFLILAFFQKHSKEPSSGTEMNSIYDKSSLLSNLFTYNLFHEITQPLISIISNKFPQESKISLVWGVFMFMDFKDSCSKIVIHKIQLSPLI